MVTISGSFNVAIYVCEKAYTMGQKFVAMSDSKSCVYDENDINLETVKKIKEVEKGYIKEYLNFHPNAQYFESVDSSHAIWNIKTDIALPGANRNELNIKEARALLKNSVIAVGKVLICLVHMK